MPKLCPPVPVNPPSWGPPVFAWIQLASQALLMTSTLPQCIISSHHLRHAALRSLPAVHQLDDMLLSIYPTISSQCSPLLRLGNKRLRQLETGRILSRLEMPAIYRPEWSQLLYPIVHSPLYLCMGGRMGVSLEHHARRYAQSRIPCIYPSRLFCFYVMIWVQWCLRRRLRIDGCLSSDAGMPHLVPFLDYSSFVFLFLLLF
ncbi:hypothetical protein GGS24DRAFT_237213 [Hypoxylon argillaceum]|nr:hypothetical protein GGS24DRAFT_237213 [Hypoxylon argillaceum]